MKVIFKILIISLLLTLVPFTDGLSAADVDNTVFAEESGHLKHLAPLFVYKGRPANEDNTHKVTLLMNHGYMVGYSINRKQPLWAAYKVSRAKEWTHYYRPTFFYADLRIPENERVEPGYFGGGYDRGHMAPNSAINTQYGQLAQLETFLMSNVCPQKKNLNQGPWKRLEKIIVKEYVEEWKEMWVLAGPIFEKEIGKVKGIEIPSHFFMILVRVGNYPSYKPSILAFKFPQEIDRDAEITKDYLFSVDDIEELTKLNFFPELSKSKEKKYEEKAAEDVWKIE